MKRLIRRIGKRLLRVLESPYVPFHFGSLVLNILDRKTRGPIDLPRRFDRILLLRLDGIGDVVLNASLTRELRRCYADAWITLIVQAKAYNLVELCPYVNEILTWDGQMSRYLYPIQLQWRALRIVCHYLWKRRFDLAIVPRWGGDSSGAPFIAYYSGAGTRVGYAERANPIRQEANRGYDCLFTHLLSDNSLKHDVEHNLDVIRFLGGSVTSAALELWLDREDENWAESALRDCIDSSHQLLLAVGFGASSPHRIWPAGNFVELGRRLETKADCRFVLLGGPGQEAEAEQIQHGLGGKTLNLVGKTTLRQAGAVLKRCRLFIGSDSALMHIAAAAGKPVVMISCHPQSANPQHTNSPVFFRPWTDIYRVCQPASPVLPCHDGCSSHEAHCILGVTVDQVESESRAVLASLPRYVPV